MTCQPPPPRRPRSRAELLAAAAEAYATLARVHAELAQLEGGPDLHDHDGDAGRGAAPSPDRDMTPANDAPPAPRPRQTTRRGPRVPSVDALRAVGLSETDRAAAAKAARDGGLLPARTPGRMTKR